MYIIRSSNKVPWDRLFLLLPVCHIFFSTASLGGHEADCIQPPCGYCTQVPRLERDKDMNSELIHSLRLKYLAMYFNLFFDTSIFVK